MKKRVYFIRIISLICAAALMLLPISGCNEKNEPPYTVEIKTIHIEDEGQLVDIAYPTLVGDSEIADSINSAIENYSRWYMNELFNYIGSNAMIDPPDHITYTIDSADVTYLSDKFMSVLCTGSFYYTGAPYPEAIVYTLNYNLETCSPLNFDNMISDYDSISEKLRAGDCRLVSGIDNLLEYTNHEDIFVEYSSLYGIYPEVYFIDNDGKTELAFSAELVYALGSHAEFSIPVDSVKDALTDTIKDLLK